MFYFSVKQKRVYIVKKRERFIANLFSLLFTLFITFSDAGCSLFYSLYTNMRVRRRDLLNFTCSLLWRKSSSGRVQKSAWFMPV